MEPQKFFIGVIDLFSVLMPGALVAYVLKYEARQAGLPAPTDTLADTESWVVFLFASYLLGHLAFLLGGTIDSAYEVLRSGTALGQTTRLAKGKRPSSSWLRRAARALFSKHADAALVQALRMKVRSLRRLSAEGSINTFQWCKARLSKEHPDGLAAVQRFEADSKFFRSFVVVLAALAILYAYRPTSTRWRLSRGPRVRALAVSGTAVQGHTAGLLVRADVRKHEGPPTCRGRVRWWAPSLMPVESCSGRKTKSCGTSSWRRPPSDRNACCPRATSKRASTRVKQPSAR